MNPVHIMILALYLAIPGDGAEPSKEAKSLKPLHFRIEAVTDQIHTIAGRLESAAEDGRTYDQAVLDLDGDGRPEKTLDLKSGTFPTRKGSFSVDLDFELDGSSWNLSMRGPLDDPFQGPVYLNWTRRSDELYLFFINGKAPLKPTAEEAAEGPAIRLGPPFHFDLTSTKRGPDALVNVGLKDANGCTLRIANRLSAGQAVRNPAMGNAAQIQLAFFAGGEVRSILEAKYG
jgi:hypothetical protein